MNDKESDISEEERFVNEFKDLVDNKTLLDINKQQKEIISKIQSKRHHINEFTNTSRTEYNVLEKQFVEHVQMMKEMKEDLDYIQKKLNACGKKIEMTKTHQSQL